MIAVCLLAMFALWTILVCFIDVKEIGPQGTSVGFASFNSFVHSMTGIHMSLYTITDWLSLVPIGFMTGFALLGFVQWIRRKNLLKVDYSILVLGGFYIAVMVVYLFFEAVIINYRPILIGGFLEASYPSSTTMLVMCVMMTAAMQLNARIENKALRRCVLIAAYAFIVFMVLLRFISGVHWATDIIGGVLLSAGLVMLYNSVCALKGSH